MHAHNTDTTSTQAGGSGIGTATSLPGNLVRSPSEPTPSLNVSPWTDPLLDALGHDPRSAYVETYWLGVLGPSTTWLLRRMARCFDESPDGFVIDIVETARALGLGASASRHSPLMRSISRCELFKLAVRTGPVTLAVRRRLPPLTRRHLLRLPSSLQQQHNELVAQEAGGRDPAAIRTRARQLALGLMELGESASATESQLICWKVHPALAHEVTLWAAQARETAILE
ncbi:MAG: hypothetical protein M0008_13780 [Actinomycetota bacterium]|jgi:hypothetical protein|nr:hypothetical protein [Actinomycetota bacterium]